MVVRNTLKFLDRLEEMKALRNKGLTYYEISLKIGCTQATVFKYLKNEK